MTGSTSGLALRDIVFADECLIEKHNTDLAFVYKYSGPSSAGGLEFQECSHAIFSFNRFQHRIRAVILTIFVVF